jgi:hypothetical protein
MPKRSISFKEPEVKQKVEIVRNNSFSGITEVERNDMVNGTIPMDGGNHYSGVDNLSLTMQMQVADCRIKIRHGISICVFENIL